MLVLTNMYPTMAAPHFGVFVRDQVADLAAEGASVDSFVIDGRADWRNYARAAREVRRTVTAGDFDVIHAHHGLSGAVALAQNTVPVVTTFHGTETGYVRWQAAISFIVARRTFPVFVSHHGADRLRIRRPVVLPAGVDTDLFRPIARAAAIEQLGWDPDRIYVLFPAERWRKLKRFDVFEEVLARAELELPRLTGVVLEGRRRSEVALIMNAVHATLLTSDYEGSPVSIRESLACGTPVVSVPVGDVRRTIVGLPGCAVVPRDVTLLAKHLVLAVQSGKSDALRARAEQTSRRRIARRLIAVYGDVVRRSRDRSLR